MRRTLTQESVSEVGRIQIQSEGERVHSLAGFLLVAAGRLASVGAFGPRSFGARRPDDIGISYGDGGVAVGCSRWGSVRRDGDRLGTLSFFLILSNYNIHNVRYQRTS